MQAAKGIGPYCWWARISRNNTVVKTSAGRSRAGSLADFAIAVIATARYNASASAGMYAADRLRGGMKAIGRIPASIHTRQIARTRDRNAPAMSTRKVIPAAEGVSHCGP